MCAIRERVCVQYEREFVCNTLARARTRTLSQVGGQGGGARAILGLELSRVSGEILK